MFSQDPVLEIKREAYLASEEEVHEKCVEEYKSLVPRTKHLHANLLFTTEHGRAILRAVCKFVTSITPSVWNTSWRDLAAKLGYSITELMCMENLKGRIYDHTETALKFFAATQKEGTIGCVLQALVDLKFWPALHNVQEHVDKLLTELETRKDVSETQAIIDGETINLLKSTTFQVDVPVIFDNQPLIGKTEFVDMVPCDNVVEPNPLQLSVTTTTKEPQKYCRHVFIYCAADGLDTAQTVAQVLRATRNKKDLPFGVVMMSENQELIQARVDKVLCQLLSSVDFVVPVVTEGYFQARSQPNQSARHIDERYVDYIHGILVRNYIQNGCLNFKVRPIIPHMAVKDIINKQEFGSEGIFSGWRSDDEVNILAKCMLKSRRTNV